jgi:hypothetical protein
MTIVRRKGLGVRGKSSTFEEQRAVPEFGMYHFSWLVLVVACVSAFFPWVASAQTALSPPQDLLAFDTPNDGGASVTVSWAPGLSDSPDVRYQVLVGDAGVTDPAALKIVAEFPANTHFVKEAKAAWWTRRAETHWHQFVIRPHRLIGSIGTSSTI